jgi:hypothetical protein
MEEMMEATVEGLLNSYPLIRERVTTGQVRWAKPVMLLLSRTILFALFQGLIAAIFALSGNPHPWEASIAWWIVSITLANFVSLGLLAWAAKAEGLRLVDIYRVEKSSFWRELALLLGFTVIAAPVMMIPNLGFGQLLFGDSNATAAILFRPMPLGVTYLCMLLFPISIALVELPTYYSYVMPRLIALTGKVWPVILLVSFWHAFQHVTAPLIFDGRFMLWRFLMMFPFALMIAIVLHWRPKLLPYLMVVHGLLDASLPFMVLAAK